MKAATKPLRRLMRDLFRVEPLEPRVLLSADPVLGAAQLVLRPADDDGSAALVARSYVADAAPAAATPAAVQQAARQGPAVEWLEVDPRHLDAGNGDPLADGAADAGPAAFFVAAQDGPALRMASFSAMAATATVIDVDDSTANPITILGSVVIVGDRILEAGTDGTGDVQLGGVVTDTLNGDGIGAGDSLTVRTPGNVYFAGPVGNEDPLEGLTIEGVIIGGVEHRPQNVTFERPLIVNGDVVINASGTVIFHDRIEITGGGSLRIIGADQVVFIAGVALTGVTAGGAAGDLFVEANEITFPAGEESVSGRGVMTLRPTLVGAGIELGTPPTSQAAGVLNISNDEIRSFSEGFSRIVIGHQDGFHAAAGAGQVRIGAINALDQPSLRDPLEVYGGTIIVEDYSTRDYVFQVEGSILLDAHGDIVLRNQVEASRNGVLADVTLYSHTGQVLQQNGTLDQALAEPLRADTLTVRAATGIWLGFTEVALLSATNTSSGDIHVVETAAGGDLAIALLKQQAVAGGISVQTLDGDLSVGGSGIDHDGSGALHLQASGSGSTIAVNQQIDASADIRLVAEGDITTSNAGTIVSGGAALIELKSNTGAITQGALVRSLGGEVRLDAFGALTMGDGVVARSTGSGTGKVTLVAGGDVTVSVVEAEAGISITSGGAILDGLTGDSPNLDGETATVLLAAASGIGTGAAPLQTRVDALAARNTGSGGIFVREATALRVAGASGDWGIDAGGTGNAIAIVTLDGALTVEQGVRSTGAGGHILLQSGEADAATAADLVIRADVTTARSISLQSADGVTIAGTGATQPQVVSSGAGQSVDVHAQDGITMAANALLSALEGGVHLKAGGGDVVLGRVSSSGGGVSIEATGAIVAASPDGGVREVEATNLRMVAGGAIGSAGTHLDIAVGTLAASAGGSVFLLEADALAVGTVAGISVNRIGSDGTAASVETDATSLAGIAAGGALVLRTGGALALQSDTVAAGNLHLGAGAGLSLAADAGSTGGSVTLRAGGSIIATAAADLFSEGATGTLDVAADADITLADGSLVRSNAQAIRIAAANGLTVGRVDARSAADRAADTAVDTWGDISLVAGAAIADNAGSVATGIHARNLRLQAGAGIAASGEHLETEVRGVLAADSGTGGLFLSDATALTVGTVAAIAVHGVGIDGTTTTLTPDAAAAGVASGAALVLRALDGSLSLDAGTVHAGGNALLQAQGGGAILAVATAVTGGGHLSLHAGGGIALSADVTASTAGKTIDVVAGGAIVQAQGTRVASTDGNIALDAQGAITLETIAAGSAGVWISGAAIIDGDAAGDSEVDIIAGSAQLLAAGNIGAAGAALETSVAALSAKTRLDGLFITESDGLTVQQLQLNVQRVDATGAVSATAHAAQEAVAATTVVLTSTTGDLTLLAGPDSGLAARAFDGNLRLQAVAGSLVLDGRIEAADDVSLLAGSAITLDAAAAVLAETGTADLAAGAAIAMHADASVATAGGDIRLEAGGKVTVGVLDARTADDRADGTLLDQANWGTVGIVAGDSIVDNTASTDVAIFAHGVRLTAVNGIAASGEHLELEAAQLAARAGAQGLFLAEATALEITGVDLVGLNRVGIDGVSVAGPQDTGLAGLASGAALVLQAAAGSITLAGAGLGSVAAAGNLLLSAQGAASDLVANATVTSSGGHLSLHAGRDLLLAADAGTTGAGKTVDLVAGRDLTQSQGTLVASHSGNVALQATRTATLEAVTAGGTGTAIRIAAGAIVDGDAAGDSEVDLVADAVALIATGAVGATGAQLETRTLTLAVGAGGDVFVNNSGALAIGGLTVDVSRVAAASTASLTGHARLAGLAGDDVVVRALDGALVVGSGAAVAATGNLLLEATGSASLTLGAAAQAAGAISLIAGTEVLLNASATTTTDGSTIDVWAKAGRIVGAQGTAITAANANVQLQASNSVTLESVAAGSGIVRIAASSVIDGDAAGDTEVDVTAAGLVITTTATAGNNAVGLGANALETAVGTLSVSGLGSVNIVESDGLVLGTLSSSVHRVGVSGATDATPAVTQSGVSGATVVVRTLAGSLASQAGNTVSASGNLLLRAAGAASDLTLGAAVTSSGGHVGLEAGRDLLQNADVRATAQYKTMDLRAGRDLTQAQGVAATTHDGHVALTAEGALTLELVSAGVGRVGLIGASIVDGDAAGDTEVDVLAAGVRMQARTGSIGSSGNALETTTTNLALSAGGDVFITESDGLSLEAVAVTVTRVRDNGTDLTPNEQVTLSGVSGRHIVVRTLAGGLDTQASGAVTATGNVLLQAGGAGSDMRLTGGVSTSGGHVSLAAGRDMQLNASVNNSFAGGSIDLAAGRDLTQAQGTAVATAGGNIALDAGRTATIESLQAGTGAVRIAAATVVDGDAGANETEVDVQAQSLVLQVSGATGTGSNALETTVAALAAAGGGSLFLTETDALVLRGLTVNVQRVAADGSAAATSHAAVNGLASGTTVVRTLNGALESEAGNAVVASGNLLLRAGGATSDLTLGASVTGSAHVTLEAGQDLLQNADVIAAMVAASSVRLQAGRDVTQAEGVTARSSGGPLSVQAGRNATLARLQALAGTVRVAAVDIAIADDGSGTAAHVAAAGLQLAASGNAGVAGRALRTEVTTLSASADADLFVTEADGMAIGATSLLLQRVGVAGTTISDAAIDQAGITGAGTAVVRVLAGSLTSTAQGAVDVAGKLLLLAEGATSDLDLHATVRVGGNASLAGQRDVLLNASVTATGAGSTIDVVGGRAIVQAQGTSVSSNNGVIALDAMDGDATIEHLAAGTAGVWINARSIIDGDAAGDTEVDIAAGSAQLLASAAIGAAGAALETSVDTLSAHAGVGIFLTEADGLALGALAVSLNSIGVDGAEFLRARGTQAGVAGTTVALQTLAGSLAVDTTVDASGNLLLRAGGAASDLTLAAAVNGGGHVTLDAGRDLLQNAGVSATTAGSTLELLAGRAVTQAQGVAATATDGLLHVHAASGDATLASLLAGTGTVRVQAMNIVDGDAAGDTDADIVAGALQLVASGSVGSSTNAIETHIGRLAVAAGGDVFVTEADALALGTVVIAPNRVLADGTAPALAGMTQAGLTGANVVLRTLAGALSTEAGAPIATSGNLLLQSGAGHDLTLGAGVSSSGGSISVDAGQDLQLSADVRTTLTGAGIDLLAAGAITQAQGTTLASANGTIALEAVTGDVTIERIAAGTGAVRIAAGAIIDGDAAGDTEVDIEAGALQLLARGAVGAAGAALETAATTLSVQAGDDVFVDEADTLVVDTVEVAVSRVTGSGATTTVDHAAQSGLAGTTIVVRVLAGDFSTAAGNTVAADGNLLLASTTGNLRVGAGVEAAGAISLAAGTDLLLDGDVQTTATGSTIDLLAGGAIAQGQGVAIAAADADVQLVATGSITLEALTAGTGTVRIAGAALIDGDDAGTDDLDADIVAAGLQIRTTGAIGSGANAIETEVTTLTLAAGAAAHVAESDDLLLGSVTTSVQRVGADGTLTALAAETQSDVLATTLVVVADGSLESGAGGAVTGSGHVLLQSLDGMVLGAAVMTSAGHLTLRAGDDLLQNADVSVTGAGFTLLLGADGDITQAQGVSASSAGGAVGISAGGTLTLEQVLAGTGNVVLYAGAIVDGDADGDDEIDVRAAALLVTTLDGGVGTGANALETAVQSLTVAADGDVFLTERDGALTLREVRVTVHQVAQDGSFWALSELRQQGVRGATVVVRTDAGALASEASGAVNASGKVLLEAGGGTSALSLGADVASSGGHVTLLAGAALTQAQGTAITSAGGDVSLRAGGTLTLESIVAGSGAVHLDAAAIVDGDTDAAETEVDIQAAALLLTSAGAMGAGVNPLETAVGTLTVTGGGDLFLADADALAIGALPAGVQRVAADGSSAAVTSAGTGLDTGTTVVRTVDGTLSMAAGTTVAASGNLLLQAGGASRDLALGGSVSGAAHVTLLAGRDVLQDGAVTASTAGSSLQLAAGRHVTQGSFAVASTNDGALSVEAGGTVTVASLDAGTGSVRIDAASIVDGDADGDTAVDIVAAQLLLRASGAIGSASNALETAVATLSADAGGSLFVTESNALALGRTGIALQRVGTDGATITDAADSQDGVVGDSAVVIRTLAGDLTSTAQGGVTAAGNLLLQASADLGLGADMRSTGGHLSLEAGGNMQLDANVTADGSGRGIAMLAGGHIAQAQGTGITSNDGSIGLQATAGDVTIERIAAGNAIVRIASGGAIIDGDAAGDTEVDIVAAGAVLVAGGGVGAAGAALETDVARLAASAGGDIFLTEADGLTLDLLTLDVQRVAADGGSAGTAYTQAGVAGATTVVRTIAGALASTADAAVTASGNLLLQAAGGSAGLTLNGATSAAGSLSLAAAGSVVLASSLAVTGGGASIDVLAGGAIDARQGSDIATAGGNVLLQALGGTVTLERINADGGVVRISGSSIVDGDAAGDTEVDIIASQLLVTATGSVGSASNALETSVGVLSVQAGGSVTVTEANGLVLGTVSAGGIDRVDVDGVTAAVATLTQAGVSGTTVTVRTVAGTLSVADAVRGTGKLTLQSHGSIDMAAGVEVRTAGKSAIVVSSETGSVLMDATTGVLRTDTGVIQVKAQQDVRTGALVTRGLAELEARAGRVLIQGDLKRNGGNVDIAARDVVIDVPLASAGGVLRIASWDGQPIIVGGPAPGGKALHLDVAELGRLQDGFKQIVIGSDLPGQVVELRGTAGQLVFLDPLVLNASGAGGKVLVTGKVRGDTLTLLNAGAKSTLQDATITMARSVTIQDQLVVRGSNAILAAQGGSGSLRIAETVTGHSASVDKLTLDANGGDIRLDKAVSKIEGLTIRDADDVTFGAAVSVAGDLAIQASGTVTFKAALKLTDGGRLLVSGGGKLVFGATANLGSGDHLLRVSAIQAKGGVGSIRGTGELELRGATNASAIHIGSGAPKGALVVGNDLLKAVGKGFEALVIGNGGAKVSMGASDLRSTASPVEVDAKSIVVKATGSGVRLGTALTLQASGAISASGKIVASKASDVVMDSARGSVTMARGTSISTLGGSVSLEAHTGLAVASIDARGKKGVAGLVSLASTGGTISDANRDRAVDIHAHGVTLKGVGPRVGAGDVLEVAAPLVRIVPQAGAVVRESGLDGRTYFNVLQGAKVAQALVAVGPVARVTSDLPRFVEEGRQIKLTGTDTQAYLANGATSTTLAKRLAADSALSFASGHVMKQGKQVDYWSETMHL